MTMGKAIKAAALAITALWAVTIRAQQFTVPLGDLLAEDRVVTAAGLAAGTAQAAGQAVTNAVNAGYLCTVQAANAIASGRAGRDELNAAVQGLTLAIAPLASTGQVALAVAPALAAIGAHAGNGEIHLTLNQSARIAAAVMPQTLIDTVNAAVSGEAALREASDAAAWRNPPGATNFTWVSGHEELGITITGYVGPPSVFIPEMLDGRPVMGIGQGAFSGLPVTHVNGGKNVTTVGNYAFDSCHSLQYVSLPSAATIGIYAFSRCTSLSSVSLPSAATIGSSAFNSCRSLPSIALPSATVVGDLAFNYCTNMTSIALPAATAIDNYAFRECSSLSSITFSAAAPSSGDSLFDVIPANQVSVHVTNPTATGWGATFGGMPVVRTEVRADQIYVGTNRVALLSDIPEPPDVSDKLDAADGTATNLNLVSEWQTISGVTGSITLTNTAGRPIQCTGEGSVELSFYGLQPPQPVYLLLGGFDSVTWPSNTYAVGGWGAWQTNRLNHFAVWMVGTTLYVNQITTSED